MKKSKSSSFLTRQKSELQTTSSTFKLAQKEAIKLITKELANDQRTADVHLVFQKPHIQKMLREQFRMNDQEISNLQGLIVQQCQSIISGGGRSQSAHRTIQKKTPREHVKVQPLSMLQRKELERQQTLDYSNFPVQPCVRSLYFISKIAQTQSLKIIMPPTIILGFGDDNRIMYNDYQTGKLVIEAKHISPKRIQAFITSHMINGPLQQNYTVEERLLYPKFLIKLATKGSTHNEIKLYYSRETLIAELLGFWGSYDIAVQAFIKQKHPFRPSLYRCYMNKNGSVYKAVAINNQENVTKESRFYQSLMQLISETNQQAKKQQPVHHQRNESGKSGNTSHITEESEFKKRQNSITRPRTSGVTAIEKFLRGQTSRQSLMANNNLFLQNLHSRFSLNSLSGVHTGLPQDSTPSPLDSRGFPMSLARFSMPDYLSDLQQLTSNSDLKRAFICTTDSIDNLSMMSCRPSAIQQASLMTADLFRLFSQYYLKIQRYGHISQFVCDFVEDGNGLMYFLQVKSFECEGVLYEWQKPFIAVQPSLKTQEEVKQEEEGKYLQGLQEGCKARILCTNEQQRDWFERAAREVELWELAAKKAPQVSQRVIAKYWKEVESGKETSFCLMSEKQRISTLYPLTAFSEHKHGKQQEERKEMSPRRYFARNSILYKLLLMQQQETNPSVNESQKIQSGDVAEATLPVCLVCYKILELFQSRYYALVFKTEQTMDELKRLKLRLTQHWTYENMLYLLQVYRDSKKSLNKVGAGQMEKIEKRVSEMAIRERAKSPESVMHRQIKSARRNRPQTAASRNDGESIQTFTRDQYIDQLFTIQSRASTPNKTSRPKLVSTKSLLRSLQKAGQPVVVIPQSRNQRSFRPQTATSSQAFTKHIRRISSGRKATIQDEAGPQEEVQQVAATFDTALKLVTSRSQTDFHGQIPPSQGDCPYEDKSVKEILDDKKMVRPTHSRNLAHPAAACYGPQNKEKGRSFISQFVKSSIDTGKQQRSNIEINQYFNNKRQLKNIEAYTRQSGQSPSSRVSSTQRQQERVNEDLQL